MAKQNKPLLLNDLEARLEISDDLEARLENSDEDDVPLQSSCTIYKVPPQLRRVNQLAYTPSVVSIGPYHYGDSILESTQELKFWYFKKFLKRIPSKKPVDKLLEAVKGKEDEIRRCYSQHIKMCSNDFVKLIMLDASFIIEFLCASYESKSEEPSTAKPGTTSYLMLDLVLLENQIPFFVLEDLYKVCSPTSKISFLEITFDGLASSFLKNMYPTDMQIFCSKRRLHWGKIQQVQHMCDLLRTLYVLDKEQRDVDMEIKRSYGISQLKDAGIEFQPTDDRSMIEVQCFEGRRLEIPSIKITGWTEIMLRNVVAFEQCHHPFSHYVTDYIFLLDCLINTEKDVEILVDKGIIHNFGDNDKVAAMVNTLCDNVTARNSLRYSHVYKMLNKFYDPYYKNKATFVREHWSTPWKKLSLFGGILLLSLTLIQTICSVIPLFKK
ncbi:UPF0481 protein At3g47200-like [Neltuma alba]|uniref:UPF0481 protein At3g47200-like n=1 Tax=Neltuma alba TaxID=207710 RepID=UPI0010A2D108|nr:UPF0481 protein At3g47200-like [Prosopis alba]